MSKQNWIVVIVVIIVIIAGVWYYFRAPQAPVMEEPIKLGAIYAQTGNAAKFGELSIRGVKDAVAYFEATTNQKVELIVEDSAGDPKVGVSAADKLFSVDGVKFALVGTSAVSAAVAPVAERAKVFLLSDAALLGLTRGKNYTLQNFMPSLADIPVQIKADNGWQKVAVVYINDEFGSSWSSYIGNELEGKKVVQSFSFEKGATDYRTQALKIKDFKPDVVVVIGYGPALNQVLADMTLNKITVPIISYLACTLPGVLSDDRFSLEGQYSYEYPSILNPDFTSWIKSKGGEDNAFYTVAFENTIIALTAAKEAGGDPAKAIDYLKNNVINGLWGDVRFGSDGVVNRELILTTITGGACFPIGK